LHDGVWRANLCLSQFLRDQEGDEMFGFVIASGDFCASQQ
jgi:hypothetical protein